MNNPLYAVSGAPQFDLITPEHIAPAINALLAEAGAALAHAAGRDVAADANALAAALDPHVERLNAAWGVVNHLLGVANTPALRAAHLACLPNVTAFYTRLGGEPALFQKYKAVAAAGATLSPPRATAVANAVRDARLAGAELDAADKQRYTAIAQRSAELSQRISSQLLDATDRYVYWASEAEMAGVAPDLRAATRHAAEAEGRDGYKLGLQAAQYAALMRTAECRELRATLYRAYVTRASEFGPAELDNLPLMRELIALRHERAGMLGFDNYAQLSLATKMADTPQQVTVFLEDLAARVRAEGQREVERLRAFARTELALEQLEAWDISFVSERLRQTSYAFSQQEVKQYFTVGKVLDGLFGLLNRLFGITVVEHAAPVWHDSVRAYRIERDGVVLGRFYLDLYARPGKRGGAWMNGAQARWRQPDGQLRLAQSYVVCNFTPPDQAGRAILGHEELVTLFHEFGHNLHFLLSDIEDLGVSGINGVEWDAVELPSQLMENFCWHWEVLEPLSAHTDSGQPLPRVLFDKMLAAKNFHSAQQLLRQVEFGLFDMRLHSVPGSETDIIGLQDAVRSEVAPLPVPAWNRFANGFTHVFAGGYAAGYYSYLWAEVLSSDGWSAFEEAGLFDTATWDRYREQILAVGGSRPAAASFAAFRGRAPAMDALLRSRGVGSERQHA